MCSRTRLIALLAAFLFTFVSFLQASDVDASDVGAMGGYIKDHGNPRVIVFVHGLFSGPEAWRCDGRNYWPAMIANDSDSIFSAADVYVVGYPTPSKHGKMTIADLDTLIMNRIEADGVFSRHKEVIFVAHSLGGLLTQQLLLTYRDKSLYKKVSFIYLFGTPQEGSKLANIGKYFNDDPLLKELQGGDGNFILHDMDEKWMHAGFSTIKRFCAYETQPEHGFKVVNQYSATRGCDDTLALTGNHREIVKPCSTKNDAYIALGNKLRTVTLSSDESSTPSTTIVSAPFGIAVGGNNYGSNTVINEAPQPLSINSSQINQIKAALLQYKGTVSDIQIQEDGRTSETRALTEGLKTAFLGAGMNPTVTSAVLLMSPTGRPEPGVTFLSGADEEPMADTLGNALQDSGVLPPDRKIKFYTNVPNQPLNRFIIKIGPTR
jgi:hypothetical protein